MKTVILNALKKRLMFWLKLTPFRISALYAVIGVLWIYFSDALLHAFVRDPDTFARIEMMKGVSYVVVTALMLFLLIRSFEKTVLESEQKFRMLTESAAAAIFIYRGAEFLYLNTACEKLSGYPREELLKMNFWDIVHPDFRQTVKERGLARQQGMNVPDRYEVKILTKSGEERWMDFTSGLIKYEDRTAVLGTAYDVTEQKKLEEQFFQAHKMEAVGLLAGGVAHDFNNVLTAIVGYGSLAKMKLKSDDPVVPYIDEILTASERAANLTRGLLAFSRKQLIHPKPVKINEIIIGIGKFLSRIIGEDIDLKMDFSGRDMTIMADTVQIEQIFMNLATNARDAMPRGGTLSVKMEHAELDREFIDKHGYGNIGKYALISIADSGAGMNEAIRERIFEPFFTTKEIGKGTGLGLSTVYGIVKQHEGFITVDSAPGKGTTFKIYFPLVSQAVTEPEPVRPVVTVRGAETVLVAEDDESVRNLTISLLREAGYTVIAASNGEQAVEKFKQNKDRVALVILDVIMPKKNGRETYDEIKSARPEMKALFMSGYAGDIFEKQNIDEEGLNFIAKPIAPMEFLRKVRETLDG